MRRIPLLLAFLLFWAVTGVAQQPDAPEEDGFLVNFIQDLLSAPGRDVDITGISGVLSSQATIDSIVVSDADGVWLRVEDLAIDWSRRALLRRVLQVETLSIGAIEFLRPPLPPEREAPTLADAEAQPFSLPELPLELRINSVEVEEVRLGEAVLGQAATLAVAGSAELAGGALDTELAVERLDPPGGSFTLDAAFSNATREVQLALQLSEPEGGLVATALNIEGRPAIDLSLEGAGPLEDLDVDFALDAAGERLASGTVALDQTDAGLGFVADFSGELAPLVPPDYRGFFEGESSVEVEGVSKTGGGLRIDAVRVDGAALSLEGSAETGADGFLQRLNLLGELGDPEAPPLTLPVPGGETTVNSGTLFVDYGAGSRWNGLLTLDRLATGGIEIEDLTLTMGGLAENLQRPEARNVTVNLEGLATGIWAEDPQVRRALGDRIDFFADVALPPDAPVEVRQLQVSGNGLSVFTAGTFADLVYDGRYAFRIANIAPFSALAGRRLSGAVDLRATGEVAPASGGFDLALDGTARDLRLGDPRLNGLLAGETAVSGRIVRDENGLRTDDLRVANPQLSFASSGIVSGDETDIGFDARLEDLSLLAPELEGTLTASGRAEGDAQSVDVTLEAAIPEGAVAGRPLVGAEFGFGGTVADGTVEGALSGTGQLGDAPIALAGDVTVSEALRRLADLRFAVGPNTITGTVAQAVTEAGDAPYEGTLTLQAPEIGSLAALGLLEAEGAAEAEIRLFPAEVGQGVGLAADIRDLAVEGTEIGTLDLQAEIADAFGVPLADATLDASDLVLGGVAVETLSAEATTTEDERMAFTAETRLAIGTEAALAGELSRLEDGFALALERLALTDGIDATLAEPTRLAVRGETIELEPFALEVGDGRIEAAGTVADQLDLDVTIDDLPLAVANAVRPDLAATGTINGTARIGGTRDAPEVSFDVAAAEVGAAPLAEAGVPPLSLEATGTTDGRTLELDADLTAPGDVRAGVAGAVPLDGGELDLQVELGSLPLAAVDALAGNRGLAGTVTGSATVGGTLVEPTAEFTVEGQGLSAAVLREQGVPALALTASGSFADQVLTLGSASVTGPGGIAVDASGTVPVDPGAQLDLAVSGQAPLALANTALAERTAQAEGTVAFDLSVGGPLTDPQISGPVTVDDATFVDPELNLRLEGIDLDASLQGDSVVVDGFSAASAQGGTVAAEGSVGLAGGFPADLRIAFRDLVLTDGAVYSTTLNGALTLTGPVLDGGLLAGTIALGPTEVSVAEALGGNAAIELQQVTHRNTPRPVARTLDRARVDELAREEAEAEANPGGGLRLAVEVTAPNQIFVRGRGLDAELGGSLRVEGTTEDVQPVGEFELIRGRIALLGQRILFDEGALTLVGNLDPLIRFVASTQAGDVTAFVTVSGRASSPEIEFSSLPDRPSDEVLALVLFNRSVDQLSPFQIAQLAAAAAELAGAGGNGLLSQLRDATGLDDLDIITEEDGSTAVRAGRYLSENLYLDVQTDSEGATRGSVNIDISERLTARGSVGTDGESSIGIFFERDY